MTTKLNPFSHPSNCAKFLAPVGLSMLSLLSGFTMTAPTFGAVATFDDRPGGFSATSITDGGITFSDLIAGFRSEPPQFVVATTEQLDPFFSAPNYLTTDGLISGSSPRFGDFGSARLSTGSIASSASLDLFSRRVFDQADRLVVLDAFLEGNLVASTSMLLSQFTVFGVSNELLYTNLSLSGVQFDQLQLYTPNAFADDVIPLGIDNVEIDEVIEAINVPEPTPSVLTLVIGGVGYLGAKISSIYRRQKR